MSKIQILSVQEVSEIDTSWADFVIDSRLVQQPSNTVFVALKGRKADGEIYISDLYKMGVRHFVVHNSYDEDVNFPEANFYKVQDTLQALRFMAANHRQKSKAQFTAITGSNGKTIVKEWIAQMIGQDKRLERSPRSYNSQIGVPLSILGITQDAEIAVIEAGVSQKGEMSMHHEIIAPEIGIFTHLGDAHDENFNSRREKIVEKSKLFEAVQILICQNGETAEIFKDIFGSEKNLWTWGRERNSDLCLVSEESLGSRLLLRFRLTKENEEFEVDFPFTEKSSIENLMSVLSYMFVIGYTPEQIIERIPNLQYIAMRMEFAEGLNSSLLIKDYYNSDLSSFSIALNTLEQQKSYTKKILILSDFIDIGSDYSTKYSEVAELLKNRDVDHFIAVGERLVEYKHLFDLKSMMFYQNTEEFLRFQSRDDFNRAAVLIKGARNFKFEFIADFLSKQLHKTVLEVDLDAIIENLQIFRSKLKPSTKLAVMVKALSYGTGVKEVATALQQQGVDYLMVAYTDEGVNLRREGISLPIAVMNPEPHTFAQMIEFSLEPEIYSMDMLRDFNSALEHYGVESYPVHIKFNTGMNRSGLDIEDIDELIFFLGQTRRIFVKSVFSHLASSDIPEHDDFTQEQFEIFDSMVESLQTKLSYPLCRHILNSAGIERFPQREYEMVRLGIGLYGISATDSALKVVSTFKSYIASLRKVEAGKTVGYARKALLERDSMIAVLPIGYADGLNRLLSNGVGSVWVNGQLAPIIGNICMDACMIDVTGLKVSVGDSVEIFGEHIKVSELAQKLNTIPYEIFTGVASRVKRVYFKE